MRWLNRLQQRISITRHEAITLLSLSLFLILGIAGRHACRSSQPFGPDTYAEVDSIFAAQSAVSFETDSPEAGSPATDSPDPDSPDPDSPNPDSTDLESSDAEFPDADPPQTNLEPTPNSRPHALVDDGASTLPQGEKMPSTGRIDINHATVAELMNLPRVGPKIAERILDFRSTYGPFQSVDDLVNVRGIGPKTIEQIRPHAFVSHEAIELDERASEPATPIDSVKD